MQRTRLLLHLLDASDVDPGRDPAREFKTVQNELKKYSRELSRRERWLVLNKIDLLPPSARKTRCRRIAKDAGWKGPVHAVSALTGEGCMELMRKVQTYLEQSGRIEKERTS